MKQDNTAQTESKILKIKQVILITGIGRSTIYNKLTKGEFPRPVSLGLRAVGWRSQDIYDFISNLQTKQVGGPNEKL